MEPNIDQLVPVPIREVWPDEARNLTPWIAENLGVLGAAIGINLELEGREMPVGPFSADLVLRNVNTDGRVVVENMMGSTNHDHLGKVITYSAGLEATHAVLIAETFRPEHRSALQWLNTSSTDSVHFFGIELKVWRIGDSRPAPQLKVVVEPDEWTREIRAEAAVPSSRQLAYRDFWSEFLPAFREQHPSWSGLRTPGKGNWMYFPTGKSRMYYSANFCNAGTGFRIDVYVDGPDAETATARFDALVDQRDAIEGQFGTALEWINQDHRQASRIASYYPEEARAMDRDQWPDLRTWAIKQMGMLRKAVQPHIDNLP